MKDIKNESSRSELDPLKDDREHMRRVIDSKITDLVNRLVDAGALPKSGNFEIQWPDNGSH
jgi:hypothetical protein